MSDTAGAVVRAKLPGGVVSETPGEIIFTGEAGQLCALRKTEWRDVTAAAGAHDVLSSASGILMRAAPMQTVVTTDNPDHDRLRRTIAPAFTPAAIRRLEHTLGEFVMPGLDALSTGAAVDMVQALTVPLPVSAIAVLLGEKNWWPNRVPNELRSHLTFLQNRRGVVKDEPAKTTPIAFPVDDNPVDDDTEVGYGVAVVTQILIFPIFGLHTTLAQNLKMGAVFTVVSIARSFALRRVFEAIRCAMDKEHQR